jgi:hypothetical protein
MIIMSREPFLGRRPAWVVRREVGHRAKFDAQPAEFAREVARREWVTTPDGRRYAVRAVKRGGLLRGGNGASGIGGIIELAANLSAAVLARRSPGWTVGVIRIHQWRPDQVVFKEHLPNDADEVDRVRELVALIARGTVPVRTRP